MGKQLWTPDGIVNTQRDVIALDKRDIMGFSWLHDFAHKHGITIFCKRCEKPISGANTGHESNPGVACQCREWRYRGG